MESDDDYKSFSPPEESSPPVLYRKLKRLKKSVRTPDDPPSKSIDDLLSLPKVDFAKLEALEASETDLGFEDSNDPLRSQSLSQGFDDDSELNSGFDDLSFEENRKETKRTLEFDDLDSEFHEKRPVDETEVLEEEITEFKLEKSEKKRISEKELNENKEKKKKKKGPKVDGDDEKPKAVTSNRKREEKERKAYLQQLHAESQRLLRETRDAAFKPIPVVPKSISSVLEKIRQRKLEVSKKTSMPNNNCSIALGSGSLGEMLMDVDSDDVFIEVRGVESEDKLTSMVQGEAIACHGDVESCLNAPLVDGSRESVTRSVDENMPLKTLLDMESSICVLHEESTTPFQTPIDDTQDLFGDSQKSVGTDAVPDDQQNSPLEEVLAPSLLTMNLKFDSAPADDISSDEEDSDKENVDPHLRRLNTDYSSSKGDPVKAFVDDEAVEEDDSDNDLLRFQENEEDDDVEDSEELNDMIATEYAERPIDNERRNELHQKWLEQQDAAGTDNLLQRLNCGSKDRDATLLEDDNVEDDYDDEFIDKAEENLASTDVGRVNSRKAKQIIIQMFSDKDDAYLSDNEEEPEKRLVKQHQLVRAEEQAKLVSPAEDENSREIFGLIKKLNIVPDIKKKAKASSFFDTVLRGGNSNSSSKSSFLGRASNHPLPLSHKQRSSMVRSFIFGRDDSNSRSSISMSGDSSDMTSMEIQPTRKVTSKFSYSQTKSRNQHTNASAGTALGTSLLEILKQSSMQSNICNQDSMVGLTETAFSAFKIPKKPIKIEGRS
ncbi:unnamed protein product [Ilex paraguariensis]|uniref:Uncharacterized protein n=1 Tax=Ilex paraguariensis TaxID=185542 RepID=A0ABC8RF53_9AQUA